MADLTEDLTPDNLSVVTPASAPAGMPQFTTAEYAHIPGTDRCRFCNNLIAADYYRINDTMACPDCAAQARAGQPEHSHAAFLQGLLFGSGGAIIGLIVYATVAIATGWTIGYVALAVGWLVGKGIIKGSKGMGGRRYQITAVALTYAAISLAAVPIGISYAMKETPAKPAQTATQNLHQTPSGQPMSRPPRPRSISEPWLASSCSMASPPLSLNFKATSAAQPSVSSSSSLVSVSPGA